MGTGHNEKIASRRLLIFVSADNIVSGRAWEMTLFFELLWLVFGLLMVYWLRIAVILRRDTRQERAVQGAIRPRWGPIQEIHFEKITADICTGRGRTDRDSVPGAGCC